MGFSLAYRAMTVRVLFFVAAVLTFASITTGHAQEAYIYGVFCDTPEQVEMYILEQQEGDAPHDDILKQDKNYNCRKLHVAATGIHQVANLHTVGIFAVRIVAILPISGGSEPYQRFDDPVLVYTPITLK